MLKTKVHWNISQNKIPDKISNFNRIFRFSKIEYQSSDMLGASQVLNRFLHEFKEKYN